MDCCANAAPLSIYSGVCLTTEQEGPCDNLYNLTLGKYFKIGTT